MTSSTTIKPGVLKPVASSNIAAMGHDPDTGDFLVQWHDKRVSCYRKVPAEIAAKVLTAPSAGKAVRSILGVNFQHLYVAPSAAMAAAEDGANAAP